MKYYSNSIDILPVVSKEDGEFINRCMKSEDFNRVIGSFEDASMENFYIFYYKGERIGAFSAVAEDPKLRNIEPVIYMTKRLSKITSFCILSMVHFIFNECNAEKLKIKVYSNNKPVLRMMKNFKIPFEGEFKYALSINNEIVSINFFSILKNEFEEMLEKWSEVR